MKVIFTRWPLAAIILSGLSLLSGIICLIQIDEAAVGWEQVSQIGAVSTLLTLLVLLFLGIIGLDVRQFLRAWRRIFQTRDAHHLGTRLAASSIKGGLFLIVAQVYLPHVAVAQTPSCNCFNYVYLNDVSNYDGVNGFVHKFRVNANGTMTEMPNGTTGTTPWFPVGGGLPNPHGLGQDLNGNLYIGESAGGDIRRLSCDGTIYPETGPTGYFIDNGAGYNIGSTSDGVLYTNPTFENRINAYDICTGASLGYVILGSFPTGTRAWGMYVAPDGTVYVTATDYPFSNNSQPKYIWKFKPTQANLTAHTTYAPFIDVDAAVAGIGVPNTGLQVMGITTDVANNIYIVAWDESTSPDRTYIFKFNSAGTLIDSGFEANDANTIGYEGSFGIVYDSEQDRLYLSGLDDCVAIVSTDLDYIGTGIPHAAGATTKGIAIARECCPTTTPMTIDTIVCNATVNQKLFLQNLVGGSCDGPICGGTWTPGGGNTGMTYDACDNSITITNNNTACGTFTLVSTGGANTACGSFSLTVNIDVATLTGPTIAGNQFICSGNSPSMLTSSGGSGSSALQYQWQSSTVSCSAGFSNVASGGNMATYTPGALTTTTYFRLITSVNGSCVPGNTCMDTSNCVTITVNSCPPSCTYSASYATNSGGSYTTNVYGTGVDATAQINSGSNLPDGSLVSTSFGGARVIRTTSGTDYSQDGDGYFLYIDGDDACVNLTSVALTVGCTYQVGFWAAAWDANGSSASDVAASIDVLGSGSTIHVFGSSPLGCAGFNVWYADQGDSEACSVAAGQGQQGYFYNKFSDVTGGIFGNLTPSNTLNWQYKTFTFVATASMNQIYMSKTGGPQTAGMAVDNVCIAQCVSNCTPPTATAAAANPTCSGGTAQSNGSITISGFAAGQRYQYSTGATFNSGSAIPAAITAIPAGGVIVSNLTNTTQQYTVRIYDASDNNCYVDRVVSITAVTCAPNSCPGNLLTNSSLENGTFSATTVNDENGTPITTVATTYGGSGAILIPFSAAPTTGHPITSFKVNTGYWVDASTNGGSGAKVDSRLLVIHAGTGSSRCIWPGGMGFSHTVGTCYRIGFWAAQFDPANMNVTSSINFEVENQYGTGVAGGTLSNFSILPSATNIADPNFQTYSFNLPASGTTAMAIGGGAYTGTGVVDWKTLNWQYISFDFTPALNSPPLNIYVSTNSNSAGVALDGFCTTVCATTCTTPTATAAAANPTCSGGTAQSNGSITISGFSAGQRYQYSTGATFNSGSAIPAAITAIPAGGVIVSNLANTTQQYTVRIYDASDNNCYVDRVVSITAVTCCTTPTATAAAANPTCSGGTAQSNGSITISGFSAGQRYQYSTGATFNSGSAIPATITAIPAGGVIVSNLANTTQQYTVRIYDASDNNCYVDRVVSITAVTCCTTPTATAAAANPTCSGGTAQSNGSITISGFSAGQRYQYSTGATFNSGSAIPATITAIPAGGVIVSNLANTTQQYTVRIYDASDNNCYVDRVVSITAVTCCSLTSTGKTLETCNNNSSPADGSDDYITFSLNPTGTGLGATYSVTVNNGGMVTLAAGGAATGVAYGNATAFRLQSGSANGTLYTITVTDVSGTPCTATTTVQQNACLNCVPPALSVVAATVCAGNAVDLTTLVTGNAPAGTLTFHSTQSDATAGTNALLNSVVAPVANTTYYVRSTISISCFSTAAITVSYVSAPALVVTNGSVCAGGSIDLASLVTSAGGGTLSFHSTYANAVAGTPGIASVVTPAAATNYYVRSTNSNGCYEVKEITITIKPAACGVITISGPH